MSRSAKVFTADARSSGVKVCRTRLPVRAVKTNKFKTKEYIYIDFHTVIQSIEHKT